MSDTNSDDPVGDRPNEELPEATPSFTDVPNPYPQPSTPDPRITHPAVSVTDEETGETVIPGEQEPVAEAEERDTGVIVPEQDPNAVPPNDTEDETDEDEDGTC